jgi:serine/threonine protein kinase/WD40 repeat protein
MKPVEDWRLESAARSEVDDEGRTGSRSHAPSGPDDPRVIQALEEYLAALEAGEPPARHEFLARHPGIAQVLAGCLDGLEFLHSAQRKRPRAAGDSSAASERSAPSLHPSAPLGDFCLRREIGRGGMGVVYEAEQMSLGRRVALKVLPFASALDARHLQRFKNEAQAAAHLHHQSIVPVYAVGCERGVHYYAMQFIDGQTVATLIRDLRLSVQAPMTNDEGMTNDQSRMLKETVPQADAATGVRHPTLGLLSSLGIRHSSFFRTVATLGVQAAEALEHAHQLGVVHRDIKPANLMVDGLGNLWVTDFGLARLQGDAGLTMSGDLLGTIRYMSPEQALAKRGLVDHRTDVYSLGMTLYELLTLEPAFNGKDREEVLRQIAFEEPPSPRGRNRAIPFELETIVLKAIAKNAGERYATAQDLADDLGRFLADKPIRARRTSLWEKARRWRRRNPTVAFLSGIVAMLLLLGALAVWVVALLNAERNQALDNLERAERAEAEATAAKHLGQARAYRWSGQVGQQFRGLDELTQAARFRSSLELRNEAIACLTLPDLRFVRSWEGLPPGSSVLVLDAAFERYARSDARGDLSVRRVVDDVELMRLPASRHAATLLKFSPDGRFLAAVYAPGDWLCIWDLDCCQAALRVSHSGGIDFSPNARLAAVSGQGSIGLYTLPSGTEVKRIPTGPGEHRVAFDPAGGRLAFTCTSSQRTLTIYDLDEDRTALTLPHPGCAHAMSWRGDGNFLAAVSGNGFIYVWDVRTGSQQVVLSDDNDGWPRQVVFNHGGDLLASHGLDNILRLWDPLSGKQLLRMEGNWTAQFSRDDRLLTRTRKGSAVELWEVTSGGDACRTLRGPSGEGVVWGCEFSPDGRFLACRSPRGIRLWDRWSGREAALLPLGGWHNCVVYHPLDGSLITCGQKGIQRWPITPDAYSSRKSLRIGPPRTLDKRTGMYQVWLSPGGQTLAVIDRSNNEAFLLDLGAGDHKVVLGKHAGIARCALSPDGQWAVTGTAGGDATKIWQARTGKFVCDLPGYQGQDNVEFAFSGDGRWLITGTGLEYRFWRVGSWQSERVIPVESPGTGPLALTRDGTVLAITPSPHLVRLLDTGTGQELATLQAPESRNIVCLCFSSDGRHLAAGCGNQVIQVWDLGLIRRELAAIGLDWDLPAYSPGYKADGTAPVEVKVLLGDPSAPPWQSWADEGRSDAESGQWDRAARHFAMAVDLGADAWWVWYGHVRMRLAIGDTQGYRAGCQALLGRFGQTADPRFANAVAWSCVLAPGAVDDFGPVIKLAELAVAGKPDSASYRGTLGAILYRAGRYEAAARALNEAVEADGNGGAPLDWLFLSMAHQRLAQRELAQKWLKKTETWTKQTQRATSTNDPTVGPPWSQRLQFDLLYREAGNLAEKVRP